MMRLLILILGFLTLADAPAITLNKKEPQLLDTEQAFAIRVSAPRPKTLKIEYTIAEGYYLYRHRFAFKSKTPDITLGEPRIPAGTPIIDEYFGKVETYRQHIMIEIPYTIKGKNPKKLELTAISQGCADAGVCYPILTQTTSIKLP